MSLSWLISAQLIRQFKRPSSAVREGDSPRSALRIPFSSLLSGLPIVASRRRAAGTGRQRGYVCWSVAIQQLEQRILLSAQAGAYDGHYAGTFTGTESFTDQNG